MRFFLRFLTVLFIAYAHTDAACAGESKAPGGCTCGTIKFHSGVDWTAPAGTPIPVAEAGTVIAVEPDENVVDYKGGAGFCGRYVVVLHKFPNGKSAYSRYAQLGNILGKDGKPIRVGQVVAKGQAIGRVGRLGLFHFEVRPFSNGNTAWTSVSTADPSSFDFEEFGRKK